MKTINSFKNEYRFLSNFIDSPIVISGEIWPTVEHIYQVSKTLNRKEQEQIRLATTPGKAKRLGNKITLRSDWEKVKFDKMFKFVALKFKQNKKLKQKLLDTKDTLLIEGNYWHDNIWGDCFCSKCKNIKGQNWLGRILMRVRSNLRKEK